jgi:O-antigen/teichoic acid export membrane protein
MERYLKSALAKNTLWMISGQGLRLIIQAVYFTVIARSLGPNNYGAFIGVVALVGIAYPFGMLGSGNLLVKNVSRNRAVFGENWGQALTITAISTTTLFTAIVLLSHTLLPRSIPVSLVILVAGADLFGFSLITLSAFAFQAFEQLKWTATVNIMMSAGRLIGALALVSLHRHPTALQWGYVYCLTTGAIVLASLILVTAKLGWPRFTTHRSGRELLEGFYFSASISAQTVYNDIDKMMLARLGTLDATGIYGAAYRLVDVSFVPISSLIAAAYPNFFRKGADGLSATLRYAKRLLKRGIVYVAIVTIGILAGAGLVPYVLGGEYHRSVEALRWLAFIPLLRASHYFFSDALTGAGYQGIRTGIQAAVAIFNVSINFWLIPRYSWRGAAWSSLASDGLLVAGIGLAVIILNRQSRNVIVDVALPASTSS